MKSLRATVVLALVGILSLSAASGATVKAEEAGNEYATPLQHPQTGQTYAYECAGACNKGDKCCRVYLI
jgi:hypothetical protein